MATASEMGMPANIVDAAQHLADAASAREHPAEIDSNVQALAKLVYRDGILAQFSGEQLGALCTSIASANLRFPSRLINPRPILELIKQTGDVPSTFEIVVDYVKSVNIEIETTGPLACAESFGVANFQNDEQRLVCIYTFYELAVRGRDSDTDQGQLLSGISSNVLDKILAESYKLTGYFPHNRRRDYYRLYAALHQLAIDSSGSSHPNAHHNMWLGHIHEMLATLDSEEERESSHGSVCIEHLLKAVDELGDLTKDGKNYVISQLVKSAIALAKVNPDPDLHSYIIGGLALARENQIPSCAELIALSDKELAEIPFPSRRTRRIRAVRGAATVDLQDAPSVTITMPDEVFCGQKFMVSVEVKDNNPEDIDVDIFADPSTVKIPGEVSATQSTYLVDFRADASPYTGRVYVRVLRQNQPCVTVSYRLAFLDPASTDRRPSPFDVATISERIGRLDADVVLSALRREKRFVVDLWLADSPGPPMTLLDVEIESEPSAYIDVRMADIRARAAELVAPGYDVGETLASLGDSVNRIMVSIAKSLEADRLKSGALAHSGTPRLAVLTNEMSIPWEALPIGLAPDCTDTLGSVFEMTVIPADFDPPESIALTKVAVLTASRPDSQFAHDQGVITEALSGTGTGVDAISLTPANLQKTNFNSKYGVAYIAAHGEIDDGTGELVMKGDLTLEGEQITLPTLIACANNFADVFVFANGCNTAVAEPGLFRRLSWFETMLGQGAAGYLGTRWPVTDDCARIFAAEFFASLAVGCSPAQAVRTARLAARAQTDRVDPSWRAYALFCMPSLKVDRTATEPPRDGSQPLMGAGKVF